jgi:hypothetical protein
MPMKKGYSDETFVKNLKTELGMGKPKKQALSMAYSQQREAAKKAGKPMPKKK